MADTQVKTANICNITSSTELRGNGGGTGTFLANNSIEVYCNGSAYWSGVFFTSGSESLIVGDKYTISFTPYCTNNNAIRVQFCGVADNYTFTSGIRKTITVTAVDTIRTVAFYAGDAVEKTIIIKDIQIEKGETATVYRPYSATGWLHSLRKLGTATAAVENPLYSDGTAITSYTIKGKTVQNGTPTPSNPVEVSGVGKRTENLFDYQSMSVGVSGKFLRADGSESTGSEWNISDYIPCNGTEFTINPIGGVTPAICLYDENKEYITGQSYGTGGVETKVPVTITSSITAYFIRFTYRASSATYPDDLSAIMINVGSTAKSYEPFGYKIPISSGGQTIDIYIGDLPLLKSLDGTAVDEISNGTLTRRVDSDGSVLPAPITTQITMPSIPTTDGVNSISVDTTVQPSEFTATWTGWHDSSVKEYDGTNWQ